MSPQKPLLSARRRVVLRVGESAGDDAVEVVAAAEVLGSVGKGLLLTLTLSSPMTDLAAWARSAIDRSTGGRSRSPLLALEVSDGDPEVWQQWRVLPGEAFQFGI